MPLHVLGDVLEVVAQRIARRYGLPLAVAVNVVELYRDELWLPGERVSLLMLIKLARVGLIGPLTRRSP